MMLRLFSSVLVICQCTIYLTEVGAMHVCLLYPEHLVLLLIWIFYICLFLISWDTQVAKGRHKRESKNAKGRHKRESKNAKQMRNTKQNCFSHSSVSPRNDKQCSAKQCFANQTNRCLAGFPSRSDLFRDNARLTKHRRKVNQQHLTLQAMYTTM